MNRLPKLHLGSPAIAGPLTVFPIWTDAPSRRRPYRVGLSPLGSVAELPDGPQVSALNVYNHDTRPALMFEGTLLAGGWQHRVLTRDVLVSAQSRTVIPVACVEASRWSGGSDQADANVTAPLSVRGAVRGIAREAVTGRIDQGDVWRRVAGYQGRIAPSPTDSLVDVHRHATGLVAAIVRSVRPLPHQRGVLIGLAGHPVLLEVFDSSRTLASQWRPLLSGVAMDAFSAPFAPVPGYRARKFVRRVQSLWLSMDAGGSTASSMSGLDDLVSLRSLRTGQRTVHASALNVRHEYVLAA